MSIRESVAKDQLQLDVLDAIWAYHLSSPHGEWPPSREIHLIGSSRPSVLAAIKGLPPGACRRHVGGTHRYGLELLGVLLTRDGERLEKLAARYLEHMRDQLLNHRPLIELRAPEVAAALGLSPELRDALGRIILIGGFLGNHFTGGTNWIAGIPEDADELVDVSDLRQYVRDRAAKRAATAQEADAIKPPQAASERERRGDFWFVEDTALRRQLSADRQELYAVQGVKAWKSSIILAGGLLEGMLLDVLSRRAEDARAKFRKLYEKPPGKFNRWALVELVDVASEMGVLPKNKVRLSHALREYRDLVHPGRQLREGIRLTEDDATIALSVVNLCFRALAEFESCPPA